MTQLARFASIGAGAGPADPQFNYVTMLLHGDGTNGAQNNTFVDSSTNNFTITRNGNTTQGSFSPYGSGWSNYFVRSSSQYLTVSNSGSQFTFGTGAFTIECWVNLATMPSSTGYPASYWLFGGGPVNSNPGIDFYLNNTQIGFNLTDFTSPTAIGNHGMSVGVWYHVAVVRGGGSNQTVSIYVNGTRVATASSVTATANAATTGISISAAEPAGATSGNFDGYISNHRVVKGTAVYDPTQSTLTVPTTPLTAITNTSLLTCQANRFFDASANALTITVNGTPSVQRFNPFGASTAYSTSVIGGSGYFDGSGDYLIVGNPIDLDVNNYTIEFWFAGSNFELSWGTSGGYCPVAINSAGAVYFANPSNTSWQANVQNVIIKDGTWNHYAIVRQSGSTKIFRNGVQIGTPAAPSSNSPNGNVTVGLYDTGAQGFVSDFRAVVGTAVYTSNFTPPTAPLTAITNTKLLLSMTNGAIFDNAMMNDLETVGNAQISTSVVKYGTGSLYFDGSTSNRIRPPASINYAFGTGNFTVEAWIYVNSLTPENFIFDTRSSVSTAGMGFNIEPSTGKLRYSGSANNVLTSTGVTTGVWTHVAWVRNSGTITGYINGVSGGSAANSDNLTQTNGEVGNVPFASVGTNMYIDDLRITKGFARYTANFTPPTAAFPNN